MSKAVNSKWKKTFPDTIGNQNRPATGVDDTQPFETGGFPQYMANDPVRYDLQNAAMSQSMSNDARLKEMVDARGKELDDHKVDPGAHKTGIAGNAATATKLQTPRTLSLTGKAAGSATFDGSANASINVTSVNADTASKLSTARKINITGNASGSAAFDGTSDVSINVSVSQAAHADKATQDTNGRAFTDTNAYMHISALADNTDFNNVKTTGIYYCTGNTYLNRPHNSWGILTVYSIGTVKQEYRPDNAAVYYTREYDNTEWKAWSKVNAANADTATKLATPRTISLTGNASGSANFDGSGNVSINTTVNESKHAVNADSATKIVNNGNRNDIANGAKAPSGLSVYQCYVNTGYPQQYGNVVSIGGTGDNELFLGWADDSRLLYRAKRDNESNWKSWRAIAFTDEINNYAPTKTGGGASGTWDINISGNAASATNADKLDGYHASDLLRILGGNRTPVITDIFDRAGTIDMSTMSAADKATHKANINKAENVTQNLWNNSMGIHAYGGDLDIAGYHRGALKLTQSYKNFDKILVVVTNDDANWVAYCMWDVWELAHAFANSYRFNLSTDADIQWNVYGTAKHGTTTNYAVSTDTIWNTQEQNCGLIAIYGIKF